MKTKMILTTALVFANFGLRASDNLPWGGFCFNVGDSLSCSNTSTCVTESCSLGDSVIERNIRENSETKVKEHNLLMQTVGTTYIDPLILDAEKERKDLCDDAFLMAVKTHVEEPLKKEVSSLSAEEQKRIVEKVINLDRVNDVYIKNYFIDMRNFVVNSVGRADSKIHGTLDYLLGVARAACKIGNKDIDVESLAVAVKDEKNFQMSENIKQGIMEAISSYCTANNFDKYLKKQAKMDVFLSALKVLNGLIFASQKEARAEINFLFSGKQAALESAGAKESAGANRSQPAEEKSQNNDGVVLTSQKEEQAGHSGAAGGTVALVAAGAKESAGANRSQSAEEKSQNNDGVVLTSQKEEQAGHSGAAGGTVLGELAAELNAVQDKF